MKKQKFFHNQKDAFALVNELKQNKQHIISIGSCYGKQNTELFYVVWEETQYEPTSI